MTPEKFTSALHDWQSFYNMLGESAATLTGLMFVAASLGAHLINEEDDPKVRTFITPTVIYFSLVLLLSALMNVPTQTQAALTIQIAAVGFISAGYSLSHLRRIRGFHHAATLSRSVWIWNLGLPLLAGLWLAGAAFELSRSPAEALSAAAAGAMLFITIGIHNAWSAMLMIVRRTPP